MWHIKFEYSCCFIILLLTGLQSVLFFTSRLTAIELINRSFCPAWVLPSRPILNRCLPIGAAANSTNTVITASQTPSGAPIEGTDLTQAMNRLVRLLISILPSLSQKAQKG